jgi:hypothetical protein
MKAGRSGISRAGSAGSCAQSPAAVLGLDMGAALAMAQALGINPLVAAEPLPAIEAVMVHKLNERIEVSKDG